MIFYLHYILLTSGLSGTSVLLGVFVKTYSKASQGEIGLLIMSIPFCQIAVRLIFCSMADRRLKHRSYLINSLIFMLIGFSPLILIPFFPDFYKPYPRASFWILVAACQFGNGGLSVAWSLGESLAINMSQKTKTPYSRMRLMGTLSWGVYGYIIGLINEVPFLPKYVPAFIILNLSVLLEIILVLLWDKEDFVMFDGSTIKEKSSEEDSPLKKDGDVVNPAIEKTNDSHLKKKNPQLKLFMMILKEDGRVIKYFILFVVFGIVIAPMNFIFLSYEDVCKNKDCNFSNLAGSVLVSQAASETIFFFIMPWILKRVSKSLCISIGLVLVAIRYYIYATFFYSSNFSPYWALVLEWGHGIGYSIVATIVADVALVTANLSKLFIPELRKLGYLSDTESTPREQIEAEENSIRMALRATMQALTSGLLEGIGYGLGNLFSGLVVEAHSFTRLYELLTGLAVICLVTHQFLELTRSRWSDTYKPVEGTKAYEIMNLSHPNMKPKKQPDIELQQKLHDSDEAISSLNV